MSTYSLYKRKKLVTISLIASTLLTLSQASCSTGKLKLLQSRQILRRIIVTDEFIYYFLMETNNKLIMSRDQEASPKSLKSEKMLVSETSSNNSSHNNCRICFQQQSQVINPQRSRRHAFIMLKNRCACKGSLLNVH